MAPRVQATMEGETSETLQRNSPESSPDPLAGSLTEPKARRKTTRRSREPLRASSPSKQNARSSLSEFEFSSPSKAMVMNTPRMGNASPWRIKVTVEAEPGSGDENKSPTVKHVTRTKTTSIPLKDADAPSPVKRRGRPRKSDVAASAKPKRSGTPVRTRTKSRTRASSIGVADASSADVDTDTAPKKRRGRPRKSAQPQTEDEETLVVEAPEKQEPPTVGAAAVSSEEPVFVGANTDDDFPTLELDSEAIVPDIATTAATPQGPEIRSRHSQHFNGTTLLSAAHKNKRRVGREYEEPMVFTPPETQLRKQLRARKGTPAAKGNFLVEISSDGESDGEDEIPTPSGTDEEPPAAWKPEEPKLDDDPQMQEPILQPLMQKATESEEGNAIHTPALEKDDGEDGLQDVTHFDFEEGATRMPDDTTILESENFSIVSINSLPSSGGLSSPPKEDRGHTPGVRKVISALDDERLKVPPTNIHQTHSSPQVVPRPSPIPPRTRPAPEQAKTSPAVAPSRQKTPAIDSEAPSQPPFLQPPRVSSSKTETPKLRRVVKAGVALQGLLDPNRITPETSKKAQGEKRDSLDDLFRGFSEGTRKELQAGLRLGEQLARQSESDKQSSPDFSSPIKDKGSKTPVNTAFNPQRKSRLLTPEEQDDYFPPTLTPPAENLDVQYPTLNMGEQDSQLMSPEGSLERNVDEMSWRVDTPPVAISAEDRRFMTVVNEHGEVIRGAEISVIADEDAPAEKEDYSDIWQEEASRSSDSLEAPEKPPQLQDLFSQDGLIRPARRKLPRTWRQKSSDDFQYSDEAEEVQQPTPPPTESVESAASQLSKGKGKMIECLPEELDFEDEDGASEASDDTGMFFQSNLPSLFNKRRSTELRKKKAEKLDLSLLMNEGESLLPETSPVAAKTPATAAPNSNPFLNTPPQFPALKSSPKKSSPLRQEYRASDSPDIQMRDESSLPLPQSSPFHTQVDGDTAFSMASDQRRFHVEMEGNSDASTRRIRNEADEYLDAYSVQDRTLGEIEEVTEPSRTWNKDRTMLPSSPPIIRQTFEESMIVPKRTYAPLFGEQATLHETENEMDTGAEGSTSPNSTQVRAAAPSSEEYAPNKTDSVNSSSIKEPPSQPQPSPNGGLFGRLWGAFRGSSVPPPHPVLAQYCFDHLPKVEPWTKTHYKTLDYLYQLHKKTPTLFATSSISTTSNINNALLSQFLSTWKKPFIGTQYSAWGYSVTMDESLIILCAAYMQLLTLEDVWEYEKVTGKAIQIGDCNPDLSGKVIGGEQVVRRLATAIMGENVRRDEKRGRKIRRVGGMHIEWPC